MWNVSGAKPDHVSSFEAPDQTDVKWNPGTSFFNTDITVVSCCLRLCIDRALNFSA